MMRRSIVSLLAMLLAGALLSGTPTTDASVTKKKKKSSVRKKSAATAAAAAATAAKKPAPKPAVAAASKAPVAKNTVMRSAVATSATAAPVVKTSLRSGTTTSAVLRRRAAAAVNGSWKSPTYADSTENDNVDGEDLEIRRAAVEALGPFNGSVVVVDPTTGRILTIVNQKLALQGGFIPCSTIKLVAALGALSEGIMEPHTPIFISRRVSMDLTQALAHSNNPYFATLGKKLGFERVNYYARQFGLGERASLDLEAEQPGVLPATDPPEGVGMMTSFGTGISLTPLELASLLSAISNGGTLYYLQYPHNQDDAEHLTPRIKRQFEFGPWISDLKFGMKAVTEYGTGHRAAYDPNEPILGKTGTCTDYRSGAHMGWFGSFNEVGAHKLVVVVMLTGGRSVSGPIAAGVAGGVYKNLSQQNYFASNGTAGGQKSSDPFPILTTSPTCCETR
jgi:membrane peptidoglycan carboxypeptidase